MSVDDTPRLKLGQMVDGQELDAMAINDALTQLDMLSDACFKGQFVNTPPSTPADGDTYLLGASPTGAWSGYAYKIAYCIDGGWRFYTPFDGMRALLTTSGAFLYYQGGSWSNFTPPPSGAEASVASAATCDIGTPGSLCVAVSGSTAITSLGAGVNALRFLRFTGAPLITYNATSLITPTGASIQAAPGDTCIARSDAGGNWTIASYTPAGGIKSSSVTSGSIGTALGALTSVALGAGKWRLSAGLLAGTGAVSGNLYILFNVGGTSGSAAGTVKGQSAMQLTLNSGGVGSGTVPPFDVTLAAAATYYLNAMVSTNPDTIQGAWLRAERIF